MGELIVVTHKQMMYEILETGVTTYLITGHEMVWASYSSMLMLHFMGERGVK